MPYRPKIIGIGCGVDSVPSSMLLWLHNRRPDLTQILLRRSSAAEQEGQLPGLSTLSGAAAGRRVLALRSVRPSEKPNSAPCS